MSSDATSSDEENLAAYAGVAVSGETVKAHAVTAGEKAAKLWEALEKRLDRELADDAASSSGSSSSDGDASDSGGEDDGSDITDDGRGGNEAAPQQGQQPEAGFQLFGGSKRRKAQPSAAALRSATAAGLQPAAPQPADSPGDNAAAGAAGPRIAASLAGPEAGRKRTHEELVQLMGDDAPRAPNRKKRRLELQGPQRLKRQKKLERIAKAPADSKAALMEDLLGDKARAKLARKQARHERSKAKLEKRRRRKAMKVAEEESRIRRGLPRKAPPSAQPDGAPQKRKKGAVKRGKFSTRRANGVSKEQRQAKYNKNKDRNKAAAAAAGKATAQQT